MNFFEQQDIARRNARLLLFLFLLAVALLILLTNVAVAAFLWLMDESNRPASPGGPSAFLSYLSWQRAGPIGLCVAATVALVAAAKTWQLSRGGNAVAEAMGGRRILPQTDDANERRCLNIVEELALAATMPVPAVYVLDNERGINAFAAGRTPADAVVTVTRGTLDQLKRHELKGVIAHEFSHILNGDMRLNIRLAALLKGITFLADTGYLLMHAGHRGRGDADRRSELGPLPLLGLAIWLIGLAGTLAASCIKAALGRQKEFLADASAVQYTRNPDTIGDALKVIGGYVPGSLVHAARAADMSHIFFGQIRHPLWDTFATHPPLETRIQRVDPQWDGRFIQRRVSQYRGDSQREARGEEDALTVAGLAAAAKAAQPLDWPYEDPAAPTPDGGADHGLPPLLVQHSHEPLGAIALACCLLLHPQRELRLRQFGQLSESPIRGVDDLCARLMDEVDSLPPPQRLPLLELCLPTLKSISAAQYRQLKEILIRLIRADNRTELHEWCLYQLLRHYLDPEFIAVKASRPRYATLEKVQFHLRTALSVLAWESDGDPEHTFRTAANELGFKALQILPREQCDTTAFGNAVRQLADCYPLLKPRVLKAMAMAASSDGHLNPAEREIIASIAAVMDCPVSLPPA